MRLLSILLLVIFLVLQYRLWVSDEGMAEVWRLDTAVERQRAENRVLEERNAALEAEVRDLKEGETAVEERARNELGMIGEDETFYQVVPADESEDEDARAGSEADDGGG